MPPKSLPVWTAQELETQRAASREAFRKTRIDEPVSGNAGRYRRRLTIEALSDAGVRPLQRIRPDGPAG